MQYDPRGVPWAGVTVSVFGPTDAQFSERSGMALDLAYLRELRADVDAMIADIEQRIAEADEGDA